MTVNRLEDIQRELVTLSNASLVVIEPTEVLSEAGTLISGATRHKLDVAQLTVLGEIRGAQTQAGAGLSWDAPQAIRWIPNQDTTKEWWGIPEVVRRGYDTAGRDKITFSAMKDPGHVLLHSRVVGLTGAVTGAIGAYGDNVAKALVTAAFTGTVGGVSLVWDHAGSLVVAANSSEAGQLTAATEWEDRWLDEVIDELADEYGFDWELKPSVSGSTITWTFETKAPRGGTDRTTGAGRVVIDGFAGSAPEGERFVDRTGMVNAWTDKGKTLARTLAASIAKWGTWFGVSGSEDAESLDIDLVLSKEQEGSVWTYVAQALGGHCDWLTHFQVGDLVVKANSKTAEAEASTKIEALEWSWQNGLFRPQLRFGDDKPTLSKKQKEKGGGKGGGSSGSGRGVGPKFEDEDDQIAPIAGDSEAGSIDKWPKVDHRHKAQIHTPDAGTVGPHDDGYWTFTSTDSSVTITGGGPGTGVVDFVAADAHAAVTLDANADTILSLSTQEIGLDVQAANTALMGPAAGGAAVPGFRSIAAADIPDISATYVPVTRTVTAGNGLTGGGALSANITITMGAPGTLTAATANGVTAESHTHGITTTTVGAASTIVSTDANSYITATRFNITATEYVAGGTNNLRLYGNTAVRVYIGGAQRYSFEDARFIPATDLNISLGLSAYRWSTIFGGDVDISTAKGIIHADGNQAGKLLVANGTRYVPGTGGNITAPGADTQVIFNDGLVFGADSKFTYAKATGYVTATRFNITATEYVSGVANLLQLQTNTVMGFYIGGTAVAALTATAFRTSTGGAIDLGDATRHWGDLYIAAGKGVIHADGVQAGKLLVANGTRYVPGTGGNITAPGADTQVIFNDGLVFGASANFTYNKTTRVLTIS